MEQIIDIKDIAKILVRKRRTIINVTGICILLGGAYLIVTPSTYQSTAMLRIKQTQGLGNSVLSSDPSYSDTMARQLMNTDAEILKSRNVVEPVINEIAGDSSKLPTYEEFVKNRIETKPYKETQLLQVSVTGKSPEEAQEANQLLIDTFLKRLAELSQVEQKTTREFLQKRVVTAKEELSEAEKKLQQFQVDNKIYSTNDQMKGLTDKITLIDREKAQNKLDLETAQAALGSINADLGSAGASIADSSTVQAYKSQLADLEARKASYVGKYTDSHPAMKEVNDQIAKAQSKEATLADLDKDNEDAMKALPEKERGYIQAKRDVDVAQDIYEMLSKRLEEAKVAEVMVPNEVQIVDAPTLPEKAIAPRRVLVMVASAIIGLILGCLYTLVNSLRNRRIQTAKDVEDMLQVPMLGVIPNHNKSVTEEPKNKVLRWLYKVRG